MGNLKDTHTAIAKSWVKNPDGSFSKPKGKEILTLITPHPTMMVPSMDRVASTAAGMLNQLSDTNSEIQFVVECEPVPAPRMTRGDKWKKRPRVVRYFKFRDAVQKAAGPISKIADRIECNFYFTMPTSWSKKKQASMACKPHRQRPDADNCLKSILDALYEEDGAVHETETRKRWCYPGQGRVVVRLFFFQ